MITLNQRHCALCGAVEQHRTETTDLFFSSSADKLYRKLYPVLNDSLTVLGKPIPIGSFLCDYCLDRVYDNDL